MSLEARKYLMGKLLLVLSAMILILCVPAVTFADGISNVGFEELAGKPAGVMTGTPQDEMVKQSIENPELLYFNEMTDMALALQSGKIDYFVNSTVAFRTLQQTYPEFGYIDQILRTFNMGAIFPRTEEGEKLCGEFNQFIKKIQDDGTLDELKEYWLYPKEWEAVDIPTTGEKGTLHMALSSAMKPYAFVLNGKYAGLDVAVVSAFAKESGYSLKIDDAIFAGVLSGVASGKYDIAAGQISYTEERGKSVLYSDFYSQQDIVPIVLQSAFESHTTIYDSIRRTLLDEDRWQLILKGLLVTVIITVFGFLLANVIGALFCAMAMSHRKILRVIADIYSRIMLGTPIVVILMILYYIVFGRVRISGIIVSIIGFGITAGAYLAQLFQGGIKGVDVGQREAALAIGFTRKQTFMGIILPQAIRIMLPGYFSELISLMKGTAVVGYIAVADLTKSGDIIRSSTFEPFIPLIIVALIYFAIACILLSILKRIQKKLEPKRVQAKEV